MLAVEEYEELQVNLELEKDLRKKAESFAQEVSVLWKPGNLQNAHRQSGVLQKPGDFTECLWATELSQSDKEVISPSVHSTDDSFTWLLYNLLGPRKEPFDTLHHG